MHDDSYSGQSEGRGRDGDGYAEDGLTELMMDCQWSRSASIRSQTRTKRSVISLLGIVKHIFKVKVVDTSVECCVKNAAFPNIFSLSIIWHCSLLLQQSALKPKLPLHVMTSWQRPPMKHGPRCLMQINGWMGWMETHIRPVMQYVTS